MLNTITNYFLDSRDRQRIAIALAKGGAMMSSRQIDLARPTTWEFSGFSQNGEDGIIDVLRRQLRDPNRYFVEIGSANGVENNSAWLAVAERYGGLMIEGNPRLADRARRNVAIYSIGTRCEAKFVTVESVPSILDLIRFKEPDVFSLDIDGIDFYIARALLEGGLRPKIIAVEYNSVYGADQTLTIDYRPDFMVGKAHSSRLYYGVSVSGWRRFFDIHGYKFITVDRNGVNAFFVDPECFDPNFLAAVRGFHFMENAAQMRDFGAPCSEQFALIADCKFFSI